MFIIIGFISRFFSIACMFFCVSIICLSPSLQTRRRLLRIVGEDTNAVGIFGANFSAGFVAGSLAAAATCPFDVAKTRRQIEVCWNIVYH